MSVSIFNPPEPCCLHYRQNLIAMQNVKKSKYKICCLASSKCDLYSKFGLKAISKWEPIVKEYVGYDK